VTALLNMVFGMVLPVLVSRDTKNRPVIMRVSPNGCPKTVVFTDKDVGKTRKAVTPSKTIFYSYSHSGIQKPAGAGQVHYYCVYHLSVEHFLQSHTRSTGL